MIILQTIILFLCSIIFLVKNDYNKISVENDRLNTENYDLKKQLKNIKLNIDLYNLNLKYENEKK